MQHTHLYSVDRLFL